MAYYQNDNGAMFINPQQLMMAPPPAQHRSHQHAGRVDPASITPGTKHRFSYEEQPTPQTVLNGTFSRTSSSPPERDDMLYLPRRPEYCGKPSFRSITFTVQGRPGPYLNDILKPGFALDRGSDAVFEEHGWKRTRWVLDWPGITMGQETMQTHDMNGFPVTRIMLAQQISSSIAQLIVATKKGAPLPYGPQVLPRGQEDWSILNIRYKDVRLVALSYYQKVWVPILAVDA